MTAIWCVFRNYAAHAVEIGGDVTGIPRFFLKPASSLLDASNGAVIRLPDQDDLVQHELEMVVRLGTTLEPEAVCAGIDVTNRTRQMRAKRKGWPWLEGKGFPDSAVLGNWVPWQDGDYQIALVVDGVTRQECSTSEMVHPVESLLETLRSYYALSPGDLVFTGTPEGVGALESGQSVEATLSTPEGKVCSQLHATIR